MKLQNTFKLFREKVLKITLQEMSNKTGVNLKTISSFENSKSNNINHMQLYINCCENKEQIKTLFYNLERFSTATKEGLNND